MRNGRTGTPLSSAALTSQRTWGEQLVLAENTSTIARAVKMASIQSVLVCALGGAIPPRRRRRSSRWPIRASRPNWARTH